MKKSKLILLGIAILVLSFVSCHKGRKKLVDSWKVTAVEVKHGISDSLKNEILAKGNLTFTKDGYVSGFLRRDIDKGTYILSNGGKKLIIKDEVGTPYECVSAITNDELTLDGEDMKVTLVAKE